MSKFFRLLLVVAVLTDANATLMPSKLSLSTDDADEEINIEDWNEPEIPYPLLQPESYGDAFQVLQKRSSPETLMRRSSLDKNFMRFGRSGFFPEERCCKQRDMVGLSASWPSAGDPIALTKRSADSGFIRFGRPVPRINRGDKGNFMRFGRGGKDNFMRFGRGDKDNFMRFGRGDKDNFMRFGRGDRDNFIRFGRGDKDNFMRFGRGDKDNFMRFGRGDKDNFMRFGKGDKDNFMRFGKGDKDNFMRFGKGDKENFMRFGRGDKDNFMRFGKADDSFQYPEEHSSDASNEDNHNPRATRSDNFMRFGKNPQNQSNFVRYAKSGGKDDSFIRFGKSGRNGTNFLRFGRDHHQIEGGDTERDKVEESDDANVLNADVNDDGLKNGPVIRRKRMVAESNVLPVATRFARNAEIPEEVPSHRDEGKRSPVEENVSRPSILRFISLINSNHPEGGSNFDADSHRAAFARQDADKRQQNGSGFIRFG